MSKRYNKGDIVYWCSREGHKFSVKWGMVDEQFSRDLVYVDYLSPKETRLVNGIPIDEFKSEDKFKKLPKGWSYDTRLFKITSTGELQGIKIDTKDPKCIKDLYDKGYLVEDSKLFHGNIEAEITNQGYRIRKTYPMWCRHISSVSIQPHKLYDNYADAKKEVDENIAELHRQANLSEYDWSVEQIDNTLNRWQSLYDISDLDKAEHRDWLLKLDNIEDVEVRIYDGNIQWKYWKNKRWANIEL